MSDRRVHAAVMTTEIVRYERAGKWYLESRTSNRTRVPVTLREAVDAAVKFKRVGGTIHLGVPGGLAFDRLVRKALS